MVTNIYISLSWLNLAAAGSGLGYAVVTTIPNTLVTMYQENHSLYYGPNVRYINN